MEHFLSPFRMKVITYESPLGVLINVTEDQRKALQAAGVWPKDSHGEEYRIVRTSLHEGEQIDADREQIEALLKR